ncbi:hypothetical protein ASG90_04820 [Nocardioides sp. Soil797]|nr:hypothetical protein ASG90_04820 [Nocardioides sp. Soil797]
MRLPGAGEEFGKYRLVEKLGHGGMGVVHAARDTDLGRDVALKLVAAHLAEDEEFRSRFQREATVLASLDSPHVIQIYEHGELDGVLYLATQLVPGGDLQRRLARHGAFPPAVALDVMAQVLDGLQDAHRAGIVHRDIKPGNVLVRDRESGLQAFLCDFGIATAPDLQHSRTGSVTGSLQYMPPERHLGENTGPAGDLYAAGCLLWALLTGAPPWVGTEVEIAMAHISAEVPTFPGDDAFTASLNALVARSMAKDPRERYKSAAAMRRDVLKLRDAAPGVLAETPVTAVRRSAVAAPPSQPEPPASTPRRRPAALALLTSGAVVAVIALVIAFLVIQDRTSDPVTETAGEVTDTSTSSSASDLSAGATAGSGGAEQRSEKESSPREGRASAGTARKSPKKDRERAGTGPSETRTAKKRTKSALTHRCWNGTRKASLSSCSMPTGDAGLRYVFPGVSNCRHQTPGTLHRALLVCDYPGGQINLAQYPSAADAFDYYERSFGKRPAVWLHDKVDYGYRWAGTKKGTRLPYKAVRLYRAGPYVASLHASSWDNIYVGFRSLNGDNIRKPSALRGVRIR